MRRWLLLVMILLLPLRGLAAVAMFSQMLDPAGAAVVAVAADHGGHHASPERAPHDCDDHHRAGTPAASADAVGEIQEDCPTCASCQVCSAAVLAPGVSPTFPEALPQAPPQLAPRGHASAEPALALKPPQA